MNPQYNDPLLFFMNFLTEVFWCPFRHIGLSWEPNLLKGKYHANLSVISKPKTVCLSTET